MKLIIPILTVISLNLYRCMRINHIKHMEDFLVYESEDTGHPLCYPTKEHYQILSKNCSRLPIHHQYGFVDTKCLNLNKTIWDVGRVMCKQLFSTEDSTHLENIYPVNNTGLDSKPWAAFCLGYEPALKHCVLLDGEFLLNFSHCDQLLALKCDSCFKTYELGNGRSVTITNPGYPDRYDGYVLCKWNIQSERSTYFTLEFLQFALPRSNKKGNCTVGSMTISVQTSDGNIYQKGIYCDSIIQETMTFYGVAIIIHFSSGIFQDIPVYKGFQIKISSGEGGSSLNVGETASICLGSIMTLLVVVASYFVGRLLYRKYKVRKRERYDQRRLALRRPPLISPKTNVETVNVCSIPPLTTNNVPSGKQFTNETAIYEDIKVRKPDGSSNYVYLHRNHSITDGQPGVSPISRASPNRISGSGSFILERNSTRINPDLCNVFATPPTIKIENYNSLKSEDFTFDEDSSTSYRSNASLTFPVRRIKDGPRSATLHKTGVDQSLNNLPCWQSLGNVNEVYKPIRNVNNSGNLHMSEPTISSMDKLTNLLVAPKLKRACQIFGSNSTPYKNLRQLENLNESISR